MFEQIQTLLSIDNSWYHSPINPIRDEMTCPFSDWGVAHIYASFNDTFVHVGHTRQPQNGTPSLRVPPSWCSQSYLWFYQSSNQRYIRRFWNMQMWNPSLHFTSRPFLLMSFISRSSIWVWTHGLLPFWKNLGHRPFWQGDHHARDWWYEGQKDADIASWTRFKIERHQAAKLGRSVFDLVLWPLIL